MLAGARRRTVGRRTNHAVEGEILNLFLVWTQWSAAEGHGGVERWKTRTEEKEKGGQLNTHQKLGRHHLLKLKGQGVINEYSLDEDQYDLFLKIFLYQRVTAVPYRMTSVQILLQYRSVLRYKKKAEMIEKWISYLPQTLEEFIQGRLNLQSNECSRVKYHSLNNTAELCQYALRK